MIPSENKLLDLLSNNEVTFFIPPYQRNYEWTNEQCAVFLEDILKIAEKNLMGGNEEHFFGSVTFFKDETPFGTPDKLVLIDGQQRITTTMLCLVALRDLLDDENIRTFIDRKYLKNDGAAGNAEYKIKLKQVETDWESYKSIILSEPLSEKGKLSAVARNYRYMKNELQKYADSGRTLENLIEYGLNKFSMITIELQPKRNSWENPQEIFESMNSLGKPLSLADLVRNYLLLGLDAETQTEYYNKYWLNIEKLIPNKVSDFIRDMMQGLQKVSYPKASESNHKTLYSMFKKIYGGCNAESMLKEFSDHAHIYAYIIQDVSTGNTTIDKILEDLRRVNITTAYSFLMMLMKKWEDGEITDNDIINILDAFRIYCYRRRLIGATSAENKSFPMLAAKIPELINSSDKKKKMFEILSQQENNMRLPNDIEIIRYLENMNFYNFTHCKLFLALVEETITKSRPNLTDTKLQIEHIMPQKLNDEWKEALGKNYEAIHQENVHSIGNLTLIRHNQELGQKSFEQKKEIYENNAGLQIARTQITNCDIWNKKTIQARTKWLSDYLVKSVLPIPNNMRKTNNFKSKDGRHLSFQELQLIGLEICFIADPSITARVVSDKEVEFEGKKWKLSPLTREIQTRRGLVSASGAYQGAQYWQYDGIKLADII